MGMLFNHRLRMRQNGSSSSSSSRIDPHAEWLESTTTMTTARFLRRHSLCSQTILTESTVLSRVEISKDIQPGQIPGHCRTATFNINLDLLAATSSVRKHRISLISAQIHPLPLPLLVAIIIIEKTIMIMIIIIERNHVNSDDKRSKTLTWREESNWAPRIIWRLSSRYLQGTTTTKWSRRRQLCRS